MSEKTGSDDLHGAPNAGADRAEVMPASVLESKRIYEIELCSGERVRWQYLGPDARSTIWWRDLETGSEFNEASRMYAWRVIGVAPGEVGS